MEETKEKNIQSVKPAALRDAGTDKFFEGAASGKLMLQYCAYCGKYSFTGGRYCSHCLAPAEWVPVSGCGTIYSWTVNHQLAHPAFAQEIPYLIGTVELEEGPLIVTRLDHIGKEDLRVRLPVSVRFVNDEDGETLPVFGPAESANNKLTDYGSSAKY
ncbi:MAG: Zn-ribbon domain-containing OB-fold protein [Bacillota bacterium]